MMTLALSSCLGSPVAMMTLASYPEVLVSIPACFLSILFSSFSRIIQCRPILKVRFTELKTEGQTKEGLIYLFVQFEQPFQCWVWAVYNSGQIIETAIKKTFDE
uniref:Uncharacterized protein n=1 Tax=Cacopsylla melanoneura TaxID=428564 RepID=A0A8D8ZBG2_9HEMI